MQLAVGVRTLNGLVITVAMKTVVVVIRSSFGSAGGMVANVLVMPAAPENCMRQ